MILLKKIFSLFKLIFNFVAWLLSLLYSEIFKIREYRLWLREDSWYPGPVTISIGNLEMGGGGKTPFSIFLLKQFKKSNQNFAHSSRAYKSSAENNGTVINAAVTDLTKISSSQVGDEPLMLMRSLEHGTFILGKKRKLLMSNLAQQLGMKTSFDVILLEDAFQHWSIERDVDVVLVDASSSMDSYQLAPLGRLREEKKYLWRADIVVFSKWNLISDQTRKAWVSLLSPHIRLDAPLLKMEYECVGFKSVSNNEKISLKQIRGEEVVVFSGIANHSSFLELLRGLELVILKDWNFSDHKSYHGRTIKPILDYATQHRVKILCTEKDAVKLQEFYQGDNIYYADLNQFVAHLDGSEWNGFKNLIKLS